MIRPLKIDQYWSISIMLIKKVAHSLAMGKKRLWGLYIPNNQKMQYNPIYTLCQGFGKSSYGVRTKWISIKLLVRTPYEDLPKPWHRVYIGLYCIFWLFGLYRPHNRFLPIAKLWATFFISIMDIDQYWSILRGLIIYLVSSWGHKIRSVAFQKLYDPP